MRTFRVYVRCTLYHLISLLLPMTVVPGVQEALIWQVNDLARLLGSGWDWVCTSR
jgi:hypothetical protein